MNSRRFFNNSFGISMMYDAILFLVMVSVAGTILLPALRNNIAVQSSVDAHRELIVDEVLHTFLVTRTDLFDYRFSGTLIDDVAGHIGIDNTSDGLYKSLTQWLLAHEQRHKTFAALLSENLGCQFRLPFSFLGTNRLNIFTEEYDRQLKNKTNQFFSSLLGEKYKYNLTAWWHPIKGVQFGGEFFVGTPPPTTDCYVARNFFMMPYMPVFSIGNHTIVFTKHWLKHQLFSEDIEFGRSSIPAIANMTIVFENYTNGYPPYNSKEVAVEAIKENFSALADGFFIDGIINVSNETVFPGIVEISLSYGFEKIRNSTQERLDQALGELFGEAVRTVDQCFWNLNTSISNPLSQSILTEFNLTLFTLLNKTFGSIDEAFDACERAIKGHISRLLHTYLDTFLETFIRAVLDGIDAVKDFADMIIDWLFDRISLNRAEAVLTIWVVRE